MEIQPQELILNNIQTDIGFDLAHQHAIPACKHFAILKYSDPKTKRHFVNRKIEFVVNSSMFENIGLAFCFTIIN